MGASSWSYRTPFDGDVALALGVLRRRVFEDGDYYGQGGAGRTGWSRDEPVEVRTVISTW